MKRIVVLLAFILIAATSAFAQKFAYIDTEYILSNIPEYKTAQTDLDNLSKQWQEQVERKYSEIDKMYKDYQAEEILLTEEMKTKRREDIIKAEQAAKDFQKSKFGVDGELFKKRQELIKPIQDEIYKAVKEISSIGQYAIIFDKSSALTLIYTNPKYDKSDDVIKRLGYSPGQSK